jgi:wobble nucleotide-excising tRNase
MQNQLSAVLEEGNKKKETVKKIEHNKKEKEESFKNVLWEDVYKHYESSFKEAFRGNLKKEAFRDRLLEEFEANNEMTISLDDLKQKYSTIFGKVQSILPEISIPDFSITLEIEDNKIWEKKIIGKADVPIGNLIKRLNLNDWVNEGRSYITDDGICPFCQKKTIDDIFISQIESFFDETYTLDLNLVKSLSNQYLQSSGNLCNFLETIERREKSNPDSKLNLEAFSAYIKTLVSQFASNNELLNIKIKEPSRGIELTNTRVQIESIKEIISLANDGIKKHNDIVKDYTNQKDILIKSIWTYLAKEHHSSIGAYKKEILGLKKGIDAIGNRIIDLREKYVKLDKGLKEANKNVTSVQPSIDEINRILKSYGFANFEIVPSEKEPHQYQILRGNGAVADSTLSEGEVTFITFLYFLQRTKGSIQSDSITKERILVIDDPISSLDSNVLFLVSSLIKQIIKSVKQDEGYVKQLILLTHNVYFHKEVSFIDGRTKSNSDTNYWILRRKKNISNIQAYEQDNPIQSSYELLWKELKNSTNNSGITIQNTMRRIIENYFKILGHYGDDTLIEKFGNSSDQEICRSLVCWINDGSHGLPDDLFIEQQDETIDRYFTVFKEIFNHTGHGEHFNMMFK